jgi:hypothetical protein
VTDLTGIMVGATAQVPVQDHCAPDPGSHRGIDNVPQSSASAKVMLTEREHVHVVVYLYWYLQSGFEALADGHARPPGQQAVGCHHPSRGVVYYSARSYTGPSEHTAGRERHGGFRDRVRDGRENRCRALARRSRIGTPTEDLTLWTDQPGCDLRTADIYPRVPLLVHRAARRMANCMS